MSAFDNFVGTREVSDAHRFDTQALTSWLQAHMPGFAGPLGPVAAQVFAKASAAGLAEWDDAAVLTDLRGRS